MGVWLYTVFRIIVLTILKELRMNGFGKGRYFVWKALLFPPHVLQPQKNLKALQDPEPFSAHYLAWIYASWD